MRLIALIVSLTTLVVPGAARAQPLPRAAMLPLSLAVQAAQAAVDQCAGRGYWRRATRGFAEFIADKPAIQGLRFMNDSILILGGGLPIKAGDEVIGGIGVGGAPGGDKDGSCAQAGLDAIAAGLR